MAQLKADQEIPSGPSAERPDRCGHHVWPDDGHEGGERCILHEGHDGDHEFHDAAELRIARALKVKK